MSGMEPGAPAWVAHLASLEAEATAYWDAKEPCHAQDPVTGFVCKKGHFCNRCYPTTVVLDGARSEVGIVMLAAEAGTPIYTGRPRFFCIDDWGRTISEQLLPTGDETDLYVRADLWRLALSELAMRLGEERARFSTAYQQGFEEGKRQR